MMSHEGVGGATGSQGPVGEASPLTDAWEILQRLELQAISFSRISAKRVDLVEEPPRRASRTTKLLLRDTESELHARTDLVVSTPEALFELDVVAVYAKKAPFVMTEDAARKFSEKVALFAVWPYLRAELQNLCARLSIEPLILPMIRQGEVGLASNRPVQGATD